MADSRFSTELSATRFTVDRLLALAREGRLRIPRFQRPLRWRRPDHGLLLDSLYRGYPVGTLLLWQRDAPRADLVFGPVTLHAEPRSDALWIVDGQQRITSLVGCFLHEAGARPGGSFDFVFDLDADRFLPAGPRPGPLQVPVHRLMDAVATSGWARNAPDEVHRRAQEVGKRLREYEIPAYITQTTDEKVLRTIFQRANTAGKGMRQEEVFEALNKGLHPEDSPEGLTERLQTALYAMDFGEVRARDLQRALTAVAGYNPKDPLSGELGEPGGAARWEAPTVEALQRTVRFLRDEAGIPHASVLPYALPLIILPRLFYLHPEPSERSLELLVRWVWRGIAGETHMATNQQFNPSYNALRLADEDARIQGLLRLVPATQSSPLPMSNVFNPRGMRTRFELTCLYTLAPMSLDAGEPLEPEGVFEGFDPGDGDDPAERQVAKSARRGLADLPQLPVVDERLKDQVASRLLHPALAADSPPLATLLKGAGRAVRASHGIGPELDAAVEAEDWDRVVTGRAATLAALVEQVVRRRARWREDDDGPALPPTWMGDD